MLDLYIARWNPVDSGSRQSEEGHLVLSIGSRPQNMATSQKEMEDVSALFLVRDTEPQVLGFW